MKQCSSLCLSIAVLALASGPMQAEPLAELVPKELAGSTSGLNIAPSGFEENKGQMRTTAGDAAPFVRYRLTQGNTSIFLLANGIAYQFNRLHYPEGSRGDGTKTYAALEEDARLDPERQQELDARSREVRLETYRMDMMLEGANAEARITTEGRSDDYTQYYNHDALDVHTYSRLTYHEVYPGIDWVVYTTTKGIKYDFVVRPGADPSLIQLRFKDQEELYVDVNGQLIQSNRMGRFTDERPVSFQNGKTVDSRFVLDGDRLSFALAAYDRSQPLTIDPTLVWATYYGAGDQDEGKSCAVDDSGSAYLAGYTKSTNAIASGGHQNTYAAGYDAFLVKFNASGVRQWGTYYGGANTDYGRSCAVDGSGNVYLAGLTGSDTGIAIAGHQNTHGGGAYDAFLVKFNTHGMRQWGTYYGGAGDDDAYSCAVDGNGNVYLAGVTTSGTAITFNGHQNTIGGNSDAFLVKFRSNGIRLWGTYYGGNNADEGKSCAVDGNDNVYLAGVTGSTDAIASSGHQNTIGGGGGTDAFLVKFNASGVRQWSTYYGGTGDEEGNSCAVDVIGNVYLAGWTTFGSTIASGGHQNTYGGGEFDVFMVKFNASGVRQWGTYYGGAGLEWGASCAVDASGEVYLAGYTASHTGIVSGGYQNVLVGSVNGFLVRFNANGLRQWGTYYGGTGGTQGQACAVDESNHVYLAGSTFSPNGIASEGHQNMYGGDWDAFLAKFDGTGPFDGIASLQDLEQSFTIWPNPNVGDRFFLQTQGSGLADVQFFDVLGKLQHTVQLQLTPSQAPVEVPLGSELAKGLYMVRVTVEGRSSAAPLVIE